MIADLLKALAPFIGAVAASVAAAARWVAHRADAAETRATQRYDALLAELREAASRREAFHASETARAREDARALGEALALVRSSLERSTAILEALEPRLGGSSTPDPDPGRRRTR